jgi:transcriptional regulator with XRE-family HTH domain
MGANGKGKRPSTHTKLGKLMKQRGIAVHQLAAKCDCSDRTITNLLSGKKPPSPTMKFRLCRALGVTTDEFMEDLYPVPRGNNDDAIRAKLRAVGHDFGEVAHG